MTENHPITPPPELVEQWRAAASNVPATLSTDPGGRRDYIDFIATRAAQWGANQELEACCDWVESECPGYGRPYEQLRAARRPKPLSLKEQALEALMTADGPDYPTPMLYLRPDAASIIRRALEQLED